MTIELLSNEQAALIPKLRELALERMHLIQRGFSVENIQAQINRLCGFVSRPRKVSIRQAIEELMPSLPDEFSKSDLKKFIAEKSPTTPLASYRMQFHRLQHEGYFIRVRHGIYRIDDETMTKKGVETC